jgi:hypothetical protein
VTEEKLSSEMERLMNLIEENNRQKFELLRSGSASADETLRNDVQVICCCLLFVVFCFLFFVFCLYFCIFCFVFCLLLVFCCCECINLCFLIDNQAVALDSSANLNTCQHVVAELNWSAK